ncbi:hypothetical protein BC829DRAFT_402811, partial [Chytridium lagenaria]
MEKMDSSHSPSSSPSPSSPSHSSHSANVTTEDDPAGWRYRPISIQASLLSNAATSGVNSSIMVSSVMRKAQIDVKNTSMLEYLALSPDETGDMLEYLDEDEEEELALDDGKEFDYENDEASIAILQSLRRSNSIQPQRLVTPTPLQKQPLSTPDSPQSQSTAVLTPPSVQHLPPLPEDFSVEPVTSADDFETPSEEPVTTSIPTTPVNISRNSTIYPTPSLTPSPADTLAAPTPASSPMPNLHILLEGSLPFPSGRNELRSKLDDLVDPSGESPINSSASSAASSLSPSPVPTDMAPPSPVGGNSSYRRFGGPKLERTPFKVPPVAAVSPRVKVAGIVWPPPGKTDVPVRMTLNVEPLVKTIKTEAPAVEVEKDGTDIEDTSHKKDEEEVYEKVETLKQDEEVNDDKGEVDAPPSSSASASEVAAMVEQSIKEEKEDDIAISDVNGEVVREGTKQDDFDSHFDGWKDHVLSGDTVLPEVVQASQGSPFVGDDEGFGVHHREVQESLTAHSELLDSIHPVTTTTTTTPSAKLDNDGIAITTTTISLSTLPPSPLSEEGSPPIVPPPRISSKASPSGIRSIQGFSESLPLLSSVPDKGKGQIETLSVPESTTMSASEQNSNAGGDRSHVSTSFHAPPSPTSIQEPSSSKPAPATNASF